MKIFEKLIILNTKYDFHLISNYLFYQQISKDMLSEWYTFIYGQKRNIKIKPIKTIVSMLKEI